MYCVASLLVHIALMLLYYCVPIALLLALIALFVHYWFIDN